MLFRLNVPWLAVALWLVVRAGGGAAGAEGVDSSSVARDAWFDCLVVDVHDGDTLSCVDGTRVRLHGIDAPELDHPLGPISRDWLSVRLTGVTLWCNQRGQSYGRVVAICYDGDFDIAAASVASAMSRDCPPFSGGLYASLETLGNEAIPVAGFCR